MRQPEDGLKGYIVSVNQENLGAVEYPPTARAVIDQRPTELTLGPKKPWLVGYLIVNVIAAIIMVRSGQLIGDAAGFGVQDNSDVYVALAVVLAVYVVVAWWLFSFLTRLRMLQRSADRPAHIRRDEAACIGGVLLVLQVAFLLFNLREGINVAGSTNIKTDSSLNLLFVLLQPDIFFFVYYGYYRESRLFKYNLGVYVISNLLRGWSGFLLTIAFFEWCRAYRKGRVRGRYVFLLGVAALLAYPLLLSIKWYIRLNVAGILQDLEGVLGAIASVVEVDDYAQIVLAGITHLVDRLQHVSIVAAIIQQRDALLDLMSFGALTPFWWEGLPQLAASRGFGLGEAPSLGVMLTDVIGDLPGSELGSWSISSGLAGWIVLEPLWTPFIVLYVGLLALISVVLTPGCHREGSARDMLWYAWLVFLIPGWLTAFTGVICALAVLNLARAPFTVAVRT